MNIFEKVDRFFASLQSFDISHNTCFIAFVSVFLFTILCVIVITAKSYESKLTKSIDMFNNYFLQTPNITDANLVAFNNKMKSRKVPKQLRKQWQQFVLYREAKASEYMSYENCVTNQTGNSSFKRAIQIMNTLAYIFAACSLLLGAYVAYPTSDVTDVLQKVLLTPVLILLLNYIVSIFLTLRYNAVVTDLYQNYQYFEVNIDKATQTLPEYVDYEVLFDRAEIKRGIPMLYSYLQKRAEEEKRELELARLKNVEHEKFNFDDAGVAGSLVLERAMQEAENYIAERKKYNQDTEQINTDITQEEMNFREITKEYNRQMQVSKETFANFKSQLEEASSSIEANYIKKQQQQELDRQRNLERDYDTATEKHKKVMEGYQAELDGVDKYRSQSRKVLEDAMMSEFDTFSSKVYDEAKKVVEEREKEKYAKLNSKIIELEEKLVNKNQELDKVYAENLALNEQLEAAGIESQVPEYVPTTEAEEKVESQPYENQTSENYEPKIASQPEEVATMPTEAYVPSSSYLESIGQVEEQNLSTEDNTNNVTYNQEFVPASEAEPEQSASEGVNYDLSAFDNLFNNKESQTEESSEDDENQGSEEGGVTYDLSAFDKLFGTSKAETEENIEEQSEKEADEKDNSMEEGSKFDLSEFDRLFGTYEENKKESESEDEEDYDDDEEDDETSSGGLDLFDAEEISTTQNESDESGVTKRKAGRPRKERTEEEPAEPKKRGRPRKIVSEETAPVEKKKPGRPRKIEVVETEKTGTRGRPRKVVTDKPLSNVKKPGRPKKEEGVSAPVKKGRGRPRKTEQFKTAEKKSVGRPMLTENSGAKAKPKAGRGRPKKELQDKVPVRATAMRGRPKKSGQSLNNLADIDAYLKEIDDVIAQENAKFEASKKGLEQSSRNIKKRK